MYSVLPDETHIVIINNSYDQTQKPHTYMISRAHCTNNQLERAKLND